MYPFAKPHALQDHMHRTETYRVTWEGDRKRLLGTEGPLKHEGDLPVNNDALSVITNLPKPSLLNDLKVDVDSKSVSDRNDNIVGKENSPPEETQRLRGGGVASSSGGAKTSDADTGEGRTGVKDPVATLAEEDLPKILIRDVCDVSNTILGLPGPEFIQNLIPSIQVDEEEEEEEEVVSPLPVNHNVSYYDDEDTILGLPGPEFSQLSSASEQTFQEVVLEGAVPLNPCNADDAPLGLPEPEPFEQPSRDADGTPPASGDGGQQQQQQVSVSLQQATLQNPPAIAPAPLPPQSGTTTITTMSTLHQPLQHPMPPPTPQTITQHQGVPHSQLQQVNEWGHGRVQVIQQPLQNPTYLQQLYNPQGQLLMPGNLQLHPAGMNPSSIHVITAGKPFQPNQIPQQMLTAQKSMLQGQTASFPGYATIPTTTNQTLVISQVGLISNPQNILPAHSAAGGKPGEMQKVREVIS
uniref:Uncharacterized protein n=1 Tax=Timema cristinae TaxID=61476 RepID=A0A7R9H7N9_TIMCR|nr:unnamed protein product [Timema cristinae]